MCAEPRQALKRRLAYRVAALPDGGQVGGGVARGRVQAGAHLRAALLLIHCLQQHKVLSCERAGLSIAVSDRLDRVRRRPLPRQRLVIQARSGLIVPVVR